MPGLVRKSLNTPEETRPFEGGTGHLELVNTESGPAGRATFQPGWKWSEHVKPIAKTDSCQAPHTGYFISGRMVIVMDDGERMEFGPGDFMSAAPGHDAWIVGDEPCVVIDWQGFADYAKRQPGGKRPRPFPLPTGDGNRIPCPIDQNLKSSVASSSNRNTAFQFSRKRRRGQRSAPAPTE